ncbi:hypothetical protein ACMCNP_01435 [Candidatus Acidulodesulfobacterium sp. H_13]|uniref:hypothetical protein n=1 Tax=Candidatus Acidulodesulfobacterium sp. H_13 TaxID=3395470 RepID=UPI003AF9A90F
MLELIFVLNVTPFEDKPLADVVEPAVVAHPEKIKIGNDKNKRRAIILSLIFENFEETPL